MKDKEITLRKNPYRILIERRRRSTSVTKNFSICLRDRNGITTTIVRVYSHGERISSGERPGNEDSKVARDFIMGFGFSPCPLPNIPPCNERNAFAFLSSEAPNDEMTMNSWNHHDSRIRIQIHRAAREARNLSVPERFAHTEILIGRSACQARPMIRKKNEKKKGERACGSLTISST